MDDVTSLQIRVVSDGVRTAETRLIALEASGRRAERQTDRNTSSALRMGSVFRNTGALASGALATLGVGAIGLAASVGTATQAWLEYDKAIKQVNSIAGYTSAQFKALRKDVLNLAGAMGVEAKDAANGLFEIIQADVPKENALKFLETALKTSVGAGTSVATAVNAITNVINAYGLEASRAEEISDKLFATVLYGKATFEQLSTGLSGALVPAATLGVKFEEVLGIVAQITSVGTSTSEAATQIQSALTSMLNPTEEMKKALFSFENRVMSAKEALGKYGLLGTLEKVRQAYTGNDEGLVKAMGSVVAYQAVLVTTGDKLDSTREKLEKVNDSVGNNEKAFKTNSDVTATAINSVKTASVLLVEQMEASLGIIAAFGDSLRGVAGLIQSLGNLSADTQNAMSLGGKQGVTQSLAQIEKLQEEQTKLIEGGADLAEAAKDKENWGLLPLLTYGGLANSRLMDVNKEIKALEESLKLVGEKDKAIGKVSHEVNKLSEAQKKTTDPIEIEGYNARLKSLREEYHFLNGEVEATATNEAKLTEEKKKQQKVEDEAMAVKLKSAETTLKLSKEAEAQEKETIKRAKELSTTQKEKIQAEQGAIQKTIDAGKVDQETGKKAISALEEQISLIEEKANKKEESEANKAQRQLEKEEKALDTPSEKLATLDGFTKLEGSRPDNEFDYLLEQEQALRDSYDRRRADILDSTKITEEEKLALLRKTDSDYNELQKRSTQERHKLMVDNTTNLFGDLASIAGAFGKKGAKAAKALAIVQATMQMYQGATAAYASAASSGPYGWVYASVAAAGALAAGASNIAAIKSQDENVGMYDKGGMISSGKLGIVGENGPELIRGPAMVTSRRATADLLSGGGNGSNGVEIKVNNYGSEKVTTKTTMDGEKKMIEFIIGQATSRVAADISKGGTPVSKAIEGTYNQTRGKA